MTMGDQAVAVQQMELFSVVEQQNERQKSQGKAIDAMLSTMKSMYTDFSMKFSQVEEMVQEVRDSVTLTDKECYDLQCSVHAKSIILTKDRFKEADGNYNDIIGKYRRMIWSKLKKQFSVARYTHIRRIDNDAALEFVRMFQPEDYI